MTMVQSKISWWRRPVVIGAAILIASITCCGSGAVYIIHSWVYGGARQAELVASFGGNVSESWSYRGLPTVIIFGGVSSLSDNDICTLSSELHDIGSLDLSDTKITDTGMLCIARMRDLVALDLAGTSIGDTGLRALGACPYLERIDLRGTRVTADGIREMWMFPNLRWLRISKDSVPDVHQDSLEGWLPHVAISVDGRQYRRHGVWWEEEVEGGVIEEFDGAKFLGLPLHEMQADPVIRRRKHGLFRPVGETQAFEVFIELSERKGVSFVMNEKHVIVTTPVVIDCPQWMMTSGDAAVRIEW